MVPANTFVWKMLFSLFIHSCMIWRLRVRVWMDIRFSSSRSPALWDTDTSSSTRAHSYQIYSGMYCTLYKLLPSELFSSARCWQNSPATLILFFIFWLWIQAIFRIVPGGVILTFCSRSLTNSRGSSNSDIHKSLSFRSVPVCAGTEPTDRSGFIWDGGYW